MTPAVVNAVQMPQQPSSEPKLSESQAKNKDLFKTRLCTYFLQGSCTLGSACKFAHHASEMRSAPNLAKTQLCPKFMNGKCFNSNCSFAHGEAELVKPPNFKKKLCSWHREGKCRNGAKCGFAHCISELTPDAQADWFATKQPWNRNPGFPGPLTDKDKRGEDDADASTAVPSSHEMAESLADSDISTMGGTRIQDENLYRMMAGRGSAPMQQQVAAMTAAISDLQAKLSQVEDGEMQAQVVQMKQTIAQLSAQCDDVQARTRPQQAPPAKNVPQPKDRTRRHSPIHSASGNDAARVRSARKAKAVAPWWEHTGVRATLGVLVLAMMVAVEFAIKQ